MPIQDSNPERRNLTVTAFSFVIYYLAEGTVVGSVISLPIVNVQFEDVRMLAIIAWFTLGWFAFRYWQTSRGKISESFITAIECQNLPDFVKLYIQTHVKDVGLTEKKKELRCGLIRSKEGWRVHYNPVDKIDVDSDGTFEKRGALTIETVSEIKIPVHVLFFLFSCLVMRLVKYNFGLVSLVVPYLLFILAIILGVKSYLCI